MGFHVDYDALTQMYSGLYSNAESWNSSLVDLNDKIKTILTSDNMSGAGADSIKTYLDSTHNTILSILSTLISTHFNNCLLYINNYHSNVDADLHAVIDEEELESTLRSLSVQNECSYNINSNAVDAINSVSDILYVNSLAYDIVDDFFTTLKTTVSDLLESVKELEDRHFSNDFTNTTELIDTLAAFIKERLSDTRSYKTNYSVKALAESASFLALYQAYIDVEVQAQSNKAAVVAAIDDENKRFKALQAEIEERQKHANSQKLAVAVIVGTAAAITLIVASGGTATPLVVGTVSAVSGAVMAGTNAAADQYVQYGHVSNWGEVGGSALLGGVIGFVSGYLGASVGGAITNSFTPSKSLLLNSSSMAVRVGANATIGSFSEVISGVVSRGAASFATSMIYSGGDVSASYDTMKEAALDWNQIAFDVVLGGIVGGIKGVKTTTTVQRSKIEDPELRSRAVMEDMKRGSGKTVSPERANIIQESIEEFTYQHDDDIRGAYNNPDSSYREKMNAIDDYVNCSPKYEGKVMRGINVNSDVADGFKNNKKVDMLGPASWSTDIKVAESFSRGTENTKVIFVLDDNKSGVSITHLSHYGLEEKEVLAPSGILYAVDSYEAVKDHFAEYLYIYVHEMG